MRLRETAKGNIVKGVYRPARAFRLAIIGFQAFAREFLLQTYQRTGFFVGDDDSRNPLVWGMEACVTDGDMSRLKEAFFREVPFFEQAPFITWHDMDPEPEGIDGLLQTPFDQILVSTAGAEHNMEIARRVCRMQTQTGQAHHMPQILVVRHDHTLCGMTPETLSGEAVPVRADGEVLTGEEMLPEKTEEEACAIYERYTSDPGGGTS